MIALGPDVLVRWVAIIEQVCNTGFYSRVEIEFDGLCHLYTAGAGIPREFIELLIKSVFHPSIVKTKKQWMRDSPETPDKERSVAENTAPRGYRQGT